MRPGSSNLLNVLKSGGFTINLVVDVFYGQARRLMSVPWESYTLKWDSEADIKATGTVVVADESVAGESLVPKSTMDPLAPFGQEVNLLMTISEGTFSETIQMGHYRITAVPSTSESVVSVSGRPTVVSSSSELTLEDRMVSLSRIGFGSDQDPPAGATCWGELRRISGMQVIVNGDDQPVPAGTVYAAQQGAVLKAVQAHANTLGGVPYLTPDGALSVLPDARGAVVAQLVLGKDGTIVDVTDAMESDEVYNQVIGTFTDADRNPIFSTAAVQQGPLSVHGPYGTYTRYYSNDAIQTQQDADAAVQAVLAQSLQSQSYRVSVTCIPNPLLEYGDQVSVQRADGTVMVGRVVSYQLQNGDLMSVELDVQRSLT